MNFILRKTVLDTLAALKVSPEIIKQISLIPSFPAPNPKELNDRNVMGQTEEEFWDKVDGQ